jgi:hypothetical protein
MFANPGAIPSRGQSYPIMTDTVAPPSVPITAFIDTNVLVSSSNSSWPTPYLQSEFIVAGHNLIFNTNFGGNPSLTTATVFNSGTESIAILVTGGRSKLYTITPPVNSNQTSPKPTSFQYPQKTFVQGGDWSTYPVEKVALEAFQNCLEDNGVLSQNLVSNSNIAEGAVGSIDALQRQLTLAKSNRDLTIQDLVNQLF